ncbi:t-SNARE [Entophlyctis helioformis]|nr:t-SNARE [Entophlyctis helioformis]
MSFADYGASSSAAGVRGQGGLGQASAQASSQASGSSSRAFGGPSAGFGPSGLGSRGAAGASAASPGGSGSGSGSYGIPMNDASLLSTSDPSAAFRKLWDSVSNSIFQISSNVATIQRLVGLFGGPRDSPEMRQQLHDTTERTREMIKATTIDVKRVMAIQPTEEDRQIRITQKKLQKDFEEVLKRFQAVSKIAAEKAREFVSKARAQQAMDAADDDGNENEPLLGQAQQLSQLRVLDAEIDYNEALIEEREQDIIGIGKSIQEVNEIFRDLGTLVNEQQYLLDNIETNVNTVSINVEGATTELRQAENYQKRSRSCKWWIFVILLVLSLIALAIIHPWTWGR